MTQRPYFICDLIGGSASVAYRSLWALSSTAAVAVELFHDPGREALLSTATKGPKNAARNLRLPVFPLETRTGYLLFTKNTSKSPKSRSRSHLPRLAALRFQM